MSNPAFSSFAVIAMYWIGHHIQFHFVRYTDRPLIWINLLYMLLISFLPFATDLIGDNQDLVLPCEIYGLALLSINGMSYLSTFFCGRIDEHIHTTPAVIAGLNEK